MRFRKQFSKKWLTVLVPVVHQFKAPAAESSGKPRVELLRVSEMASKAKWIPKRPHSHSLQYTADGLRLLVGTDRGVSSIHPFYFFELLEHRGEGSRDASFSDALQQIYFATGSGLKWFKRYPPRYERCLGLCRAFFDELLGPSIPAPMPAPVVDPMAAKAVPIRAKRELKPKFLGTSVLNHPRHNETQPNPALPISK